jgi:hypothetical protein
MIWGFYIVSTVFFKFILGDGQYPYIRWSCKKNNSTYYLETEPWEHTVYNVEWVKDGKLRDHFLSLGQL